MLRNINRDQTCDSCWKDLPFGFRFLLLFSIGYNVIGMLLGFLLTGAYFDADKVVHDFQIWRMFFSFLPAGVMPGAIIGILFNFYWLLSIYPAIQKKLSTVYILIETIIQNLLINLVLTLMGIIIFNLFSVEPEQFNLFSLGFLPMVMIVMWFQASQTPDQHTTLFCLPCLIPMKYIPIIILGFTVIMSPAQIPTLLVAFTLGYLQFMHFKRRFIKLPLKLYRKIDRLMPNIISGRPEYVRVQSVQVHLRLECYQVITQVDRNPYATNNQSQSKQVNKVEVIGFGVSIGGTSNSNPQDFKGFWASKAQKPQQMEIQPKIAPQFKKPSPYKPIDENFFNDSGFQLKDKQQVQKQSEEELEQKPQKKLAKQNLLE